LEKWEKEISASSKRPYQSATKGAHLFIGSSTSALENPGEDFPEHRAINRGFGGSESSIRLISPSAHLPYQPAKSSCAPAQRSLAAKSVEQSRHFKEFVAKIQANLPETEIVFISLVKHRGWRQADKENAVNDLVEKFAARHSPRVRFIDAGQFPLDSDGKPRPELFLPESCTSSRRLQAFLTARVRAADDCALLLATKSPLAGYYRQRSYEA